MKQNPLYEDKDLAYIWIRINGIKKYQWVAIPLALHGVIVKKSGEKVFVNIGEADSDPVFCISDLLVHLAQEQMSKDAKSVIEGEALNLIVGGRPLADEEKDAMNGPQDPGRTKLRRGGGRFPLCRAGNRSGRQGARYGL